MIPTRLQIQEKIKEVKSTLRTETYAKVDAWLTKEECPEKDKEKILSDLESYEGY